MRREKGACSASGRPQRATQHVHVVDEPRELAEDRGVAPRYEAFEDSIVDLADDEGDVAAWLQEHRGCDAHPELF